LWERERGAWAEERSSFAAERAGWVTEKMGWEAERRRLKKERKAMKGKAEKTEIEQQVKVSSIFSEELQTPELTFSPLTEARGPSQAR